MDGTRQRGRPVADCRIDIISNAKRCIDQQIHLYGSMYSSRYAIPRTANSPRTCAIIVDTALLLLNVSY